jgi:hypothetical protein
MLVQAERVRESQIALVAERDRAFSELERLQAAVAEAQTAADEQTRLLAEEQDRRHAEQRSLVAQRKLLEQELGEALERLAAATAVAAEHETQLEAIRRLIDPSAGAEAKAEPEIAADEPAAEITTPEAEPDPVDYALFVPGPKGYQLVRQTGVPPQAGETVEVIPPDSEQPAWVEVARCARTLPGGGLCVYLAPR